MDLKEYYGMIADNLMSLGSNMPSEREKTCSRTVWDNKMMDVIKHKDRDALTFRFFTDEKETAIFCLSMKACYVMVKAIEKQFQDNYKERLEKENKT